MIKQKAAWKSYSGNDKHSMIPPEEVIIDQYLSFSFNPADQPDFVKFYNIGLNDLYKWSRQISDILSSLKYAKIDVLMECSKMGRLHYHGVILISDPIRFCINDIKKLKLYGTFEIDKIKDLTVWLKYCTKQRSLMEKYTTFNQMVYRINTISDVDIDCFDDFD